jgi:hypothetical protein
LLDDLGFNQEHRAAVAATVQVPVLCATTLIARMLGEIL